MGVEPLAHGELVGLSRAQNGAITARQLYGAGLTREGIRARVRRGRLIPLFRGVYAVGDPQLLPFARLAAVLLSLGPSALLSHRSAAAVWGLVQPDPDTIDATAVGRHPGSRPGLRLHRIKHLHPADTATHQSLRLTSPARTMIDFAAQATSSELLDAFGDARARGLLSDSALNASLIRAPRNHPGAAIVRAILDDGGSYDRSEAERIMRRLCQQAQLPEPLVNVRVEGPRADFFWPEARLILEVDGRLTHGGRIAFENDRRRDQIHIAAGYVVIRVTWRQLRHEPLAVLARLAQAMAHRAA